MGCLVQAGSCAPREEEQRGGWQAVDAAESAWSLDEPDGPPGARRRLLLISLAKPPLTETEVTWKKGAPGICSGGASLPCHARLLLVALSGVVDGARTASSTGFIRPLLCVTTHPTDNGGHVAHWRTCGSYLASLTTPFAPHRAGRRQDNRAAQRPGGGTRTGVRFFADDEDEFGLEDLLQARRRKDSALSSVCAVNGQATGAWKMHCICSLKARPTWEKLGSGLLSSVWCEWVGHELQNHALN